MTRRKKAKSETRDLVDFDKRYILHSYSVQSEYRSPIIVRGKGSYLFDSEGKAYLDFSSSSYVVASGHQNPRIIEEITSQANKLCFTNMANEPKSLLAKKLVELTKSRFAKVFFSNSGGAAVETAVKIAKQYTHKFKIVSMWRSYHGSPLTNMSCNGYPQGSADFGPLLIGHIKVPPAYCYRCYFNMDRSNCDLACVNFLEKTIEWEGRDTIAAIVAEPIIADNVIIPPRGYWTRIREVCDQHGILLIADEVSTGFGRTGKMFALNHWRIDSDIMAVSKGISSGYLPISATLVNEDISKFYDNNYFSHGYTYEGHALCCAASLANIDYIIKNELLENASKMGDYLLRKLSKLKESHQCIGDLRGLGLLCGVELVKNREKKQGFVDETEPIRGVKPEQPIGVFFAGESLKRGLILEALPFTNTIVISPPLSVTKEEIDKGVDVLDVVLTDVDRLCR